MFNRRFRSSWSPRWLTALLLLLVAWASPEAPGQTPHPEWTLFAPNSATSTYLIDLTGTVRHQWPSAYRPGLTAYLLDSGGLLRTGNDITVAGFQAGGRGGRIQRIAWDGTLEWNYLLADSNRRQHHDAMPMPNGNVLAIVWERKTTAEAIAAGRNPATIPAGELWSEAILEIQPSGATGGVIVWEWHVWDHLVQNFDATKPNFAPPSSRPDRININYTGSGGMSADWLHMNGLDYNAALDQIVLSVHNFSEFWIISHATGGGGGAGDLLYRWGNAAAYGLGTAADQKLFQQHNPQWIDDGLPGAGHILVYNNGTGRPGEDYSSVDEIMTPLAVDGTYTRTAGQSFGPALPVWLCDAADGVRFFSSNISGAQRLANGNTLVCVGMPGEFIELSTTCQTVWSYTNPFGVPASNAAVFRASRIDRRDPRLEGLLWCAADFDGDGTLNSADFFAFLTAFFNTDPAADFNADGQVNSQDFFNFLVAFFAGCA